MGWKIKKEEPEPLPEFPEEEEEKSYPKVDSEIKALKEQIKKLEEKERIITQQEDREIKQKKEEEPQTENKNQISKQEIIDIIEGNLNRIVQLVEVLRRM